VLIAPGKIDDTVGPQPRKGELRPRPRGPGLQADLALAGHGGLGGGAIPADAHAEPFQLAPAVVQQVQPEPGPVAREAGDHHLAAEEAQAPLLVAEAAADLEDERARIGGRALRVIARAEPHGERESGAGHRRAEAAVPPDEQVRDLAERGRAVVHDGEVGDVRQLGGGSCAGKAIIRPGPRRPQDRS
jgi:hypothetical protein